MSKVATRLCFMLYAFTIAVAGGREKNSKRNHFYPRSKSVASANAVYNVGAGVNDLCPRRKRVSPSSELCRQKIILARGRDLAIQQCQDSFKDRRWNCTTSKSYKRLIRSGTREGAFLTAVISAGYVHSVAKACYAGELWQCRCDRSKQDDSSDGQWKWGGCSHDVESGYKWAKKYTDQQRYSRDFKTRLHHHNNEAGRSMVTRNMKRDCRCHGLSGSCALQTCWRKMADFSQVANLLLDRYDGAPKVTNSNDGSNRLIPAQRGVKPPERGDLVFSEKSPNYCLPNRKYGTSGTVGRECDPKSMRTGGCGILCCGRGFMKLEYKVRENCNCVFEWCCEVKCQSCVVTKTVHVCR